MAFARREMIERWIGAQEGRLELIDEEIRMLAQQAEQCRQRLVKAVQDRTIMEKLREQERMGWLLEQERAERRFFDELAVRDFIDQQHQEKDAESEERIAG
jgi:flagellar export protein FliJ